MQKISIPENDPAITWQFSRSSGPGGQNVNKSETKVTLYFDIVKSNTLDTEQKRLLLAGRATEDNDLYLHVLQNRMTSNGRIFIHNQESASRETNRAQALETLNELLTTALHIPEERRLGLLPKARSKHQAAVRKEQLAKYREKRNSYE